MIVTSLGIGLLKLNFAEAIAEVVPRIAKVVVEARHTLSCVGVVGHKTHGRT